MVRNSDEIVIAVSSFCGCNVTNFKAKKNLLARLIERKKTRELRASLNFIEKHFLCQLFAGALKISHGIETPRDTHMAKKNPHARAAVIRLAKCQEINFFLSLASRMNATILKWSARRAVSTFRVGKLETLTARK
jgi:hypothetical protein